ncbi:MAG: NAD(P)H-dependent oxidoreductase subunit E [Actinobacteria bacterium]|nr:NAD(P)H-dependent oxidoreductase subunit E [Actinomycetota bacterium]
MAISEQVRAECRQLMDRYPQDRSALVPMLHLLQSEQGMVTAEGLELCAELLDLSTAEVRAVATFYTMYRLRSQGGEHHIGVCVNTACGLLGGDAIFDALSKRLSVSNGEVTADGRFTLERIECQAACTHSPVVTVDWEYFDQMDIDKMMDVIDKLEAGEEVVATRGPAVRGWRAAEKTIAGIDDGLGYKSDAIDSLMLAGLNQAKERGETAPDPKDF